MAAIHNVPNVTDDWSDQSNWPNQGVSQYYFYSDYDPATHFEYKIPFSENGATPDIEELNRDYDPTTNKSGGPKIQALAKALEYHLSFEQVLPAENREYVEFYRPIYSNSNPFDPQDYTGIASIDYKNISETDLLNSNPPKLKKLPTKAALVDSLREDRYIENDYSKMTFNKLQELYDKTLKQQGTYGDATRWNIHCYNCALYCRVERPMKVEYYKKSENEWATRICQMLDSNGNRAFYSTDTEAIKYTDMNGDEIKDTSASLIRYPKMTYVSAYEFRKYIRQVNSVFGTKIPAEEGWYRYNKLTRKWEFICNIEPTTHLYYNYHGAGETNG